MDGTIALIVRGMTQISGRVISEAHDLRVIGRTGVGYDNIDVNAATELGIPVVFTPGAGARAVAEGTLAMILALVKQLPELDHRTRCGDWQARETVRIGDLEGTVLGIIGLGRIGREVALLARTFTMRIISYDPAVTKDQADELGVELVDFEHLLKTSDIISIHAPLNAQTRGMFTAHRLGMVKRGAILVNLARGALVESLDVLEEALKAGKLSGLALDVYPLEPPDNSHPIFRHRNVLFSPHAMGLSVKAAHATFVMVSTGVAAVLDNQIPGNIVNPEVFKRGLRVPRSTR
jgi:D-3-phosphoglycerate dehydrogenase